jgi:hypothetical protein
MPMPTHPRRSLALMVGVFVLVGSLVATTASAASPVYLNQAGLRTAVQPSAFPFANYNDPHNPNILAEARLLSASWSGWGAATATAQGQAHVQWVDASTGPHNLQEVTVPVVITASGLQTCGGIQVYTSLVMSPAPGATVPPHFSQVDRDEQVGPCRVHAGDYVARQSEGRDPNGCYFKGLREVLIRSPFSLLYCAMRWKGWGHSSTSGLGVAMIGFSQYGLRVRLSRIRWCSKWTVSYTQEIAEVWGAGEEPQRQQGDVSPREAAKLRSLIGRAGQPHKTVRLTMPRGAGCV